MKIGIPGTRPVTLWAPDPPGRYDQRLWTRDGWTNVVRDDENGDPLTDEVDPSPDWPTPEGAEGRAWLKWGLTAVAAVAALGAAVAFWRRGGAGEPEAPPTPTSRPERTVQRVKGVPTRRVVDFTRAGPVVENLADGSTRRIRPLTELEYADAVPDAVRHLPNVKVFSTPMRD